MHNLPKRKTMALPESTVKDQEASKNYYSTGSKNSSLESGINTIKIFNKRNSVVSNINRPKVYREKKKSETIERKSAIQ